MAVKPNDSGCLGLALRVGIRLKALTVQEICLPPTGPVGNKRKAWDLLPRHFQILGTFTGTFRALGP